MDLRFSSLEYPVAMRALRTAACGNAPLSADGAAFLRAVATVTAHPIRVEALLPIDPALVAARIRCAATRLRLVQLCAVAVLQQRPVSRAAVTYVRLLAAALEVREPVLAVLDAVAGGRRVRARLLTMRRLMAVVLGEAWRDAGWRGPARLIGALFLRLTVDRDRALANHRLGLLPADTLGRRYWEHMTERGFGFPGDRGGIPQSVAYHDVGHVLTGYGTDPDGEIRQGAFQAGSRRCDGFAFLQFVMLQFHQGIKVTPVAPPATDRFAPLDVLWAVARGSRCNVDVTHRWDYRSLLTLPLVEVRDRLGLLPAAPPPGDIVETRATPAREPAEVG